MQINSGTITATENAVVVVGSAEADWAQVLPGNLFICQNKIYQIVAVNPTLKQLTLSPAWSTASVTEAAYAIVRDFSPNLGLPLLNPGDLEAAAIVTRAFQVLDTVVSEAAGESGVTDYVLVKNAHGFAVGNALTLNGGNWQLATSTTTASAMVLGVVSAVPDTDTFWLRTFGKIASLHGVNTSAGTLLYLRQTVTYVGGLPVNLCTGDPVDTGTLKVPLLQADGPTSGYLLALASTVGTPFGPDQAGLVPPPSNPTGSKFLNDLGQWVTVALANQTIAAQHLASGSVDWAGITAQTPGASILAALTDLNDRVLQLEGRTSYSSVNYYRAVFTLNSDNTSALMSGSYNWTLPLGVRYLRATLFSGRLYRYSGSTMSPLPDVKTVLVAQALIDLNALTALELQVDTVKVRESAADQVKAGRFVRLWATSGSRSNLLAVDANTANPKFTTALPGLLVAKAYGEVGWGHNQFLIWPTGIIPQYANTSLGHYAHYGFFGGAIVLEYGPAVQQLESAW